MNFRVGNKKNNTKINKNKLKRELCISISKNMDCLDYLEEVESKCEDMYKYSQSDEDRIILQKLKWIEFQIDYLTEQYGRCLKEQGGCCNVIEPAEW